MKYVVIVSGGMDSITLLKWLHSNGNKLRALSFDYGQRHKKELLYAKRMCKKLKVPHQIISLHSLTPLLNCSALTGRIKVPEGHYEDKSMRSTVVPNRNMIMISIAVGYAENIKFDAVAIANHAGDHAIYPDCREEFIKALSSACQLATYNHIPISAPFTNLMKKDIAHIGKQLGIDYEKETWSCYKGLKKPCGKCGTCVERIEALEKEEEACSLQ